MSKTTKATVILLMAWMLGPGAVAADEASDDAEPADEQRPAAASKIEFVFVKESYIPDANTIATKLAVPLQLTPFNVGAVDDLLLREQGAVALPDALTNVSGLHVQPGSGVHDYFVIRGFDSLSSGLVLTDGAAEPEVTVYPMYNVEGIEVLKGPGGFLYGSDPLAGVINIVRKQPVPSSFLHLAGQLGSFDTAHGELDWNVADASGQRSFRLNGMWRESDQYRDDQDSRHRAINPAFALAVGQRGKLNVNLEYVEAEYTPDSGLPLVDGALPDVPRKRSYQSPFDLSDQTIYRLQVDYQTPLGERVTLRNKTYHRELDWETRGTLLTGVVPNFINFRPETTRFLNILDDRQRFSGNQLELILDARSGSVEHDVLFGLETARRTDRFSLSGALLPNLDVFDPVETAAPPLMPFPIAAGNEAPTGDSETLIVAPYVVDQIAFTPRLRVLLGARLDWIDFEDPENDTARDTGRLSPMAGVVFAPTPALSLYANGSRSFAPPSPRALGEPAPEEGLEFEIGAKKKFRDGRVQSTVAVYQLERENIPIPDDTGFLQQVGDQRSRGFELELAAEPRPRTRTFFAYSYNDAELTRFSERVIVGVDPMFNPIFATVDRSGNRPAFVPDHLARGWASHSFENGFGVGGGVRYFSQQFIDEDNTFRIDAAAVVDATVFYRFPQWTVKLDVKNLTDEDYEMRGFGPNSVIPAPGIHAYLGFECRLR